VIALVEVGIVDEALPADRGARLFEVAAHRQDELVLVPPRERLEPRGVLERRARIVHRARADDNDEAGIAVVQHAGDRPPRVGHDIRCPLGDGDLLEQDRGRQQRPHLGDAEVVGRLEHRNADCTTLSRPADARVRTARQGLVPSRF
jgi:hypothetical protein